MKGQFTMSDSADVSANGEIEGKTTRTVVDGYKFTKCHNWVEENLDKFNADENGVSDLTYKQVSELVTANVPELGGLVYPPSSVPRLLKHLPITLRGTRGPNDRRKTNAKYAPRGEFNKLKEHCADLTERLGRMERYLGIKSNPIAAVPAQPQGSAQDVPVSPPESVTQPGYPDLNNPGRVQPVPRMPGQSVVPQPSVPQLPPNDQI